MGKTTQRNRTAVKKRGRPKSNRRPNPGSSYWTTEQLAAHYGCSVATIRRKVHNLELPQPDLRFWAWRWHVKVIERHDRNKVRETA